MQLVLEGDTFNDILAQALELTSREGKRPEQTPDRTHPQQEASLPSEVLEFVELKAGSHATRRHLTEMYLTRVADLGTELEIGTSSRTKDKRNHYLMVRDSGPRRFGAVAYVRPSTGGITLRLPESAAAGRTHAKARNLTNKDRAYQIRVQLTTETAVAEAVELTQLALEDVRQVS